MESVKTCATCRHSVIGRRDPMDWWKRRLCAHPGLVDRVEGRPLYEAAEARSKERECGPAGTLWEPVDVVVKTTEGAGAWITTDPHQNRIGPGKIMVYPDARQVDPVDDVLMTASKVQTQFEEGLRRHAPVGAGKWNPALFSGDLPQGEGLKVEIRPAQLGTVAPREEGGTVVIDPGMLPRKPRKRRAAK